MQNKNIGRDVQQKFHTSNYEDTEKSLLMGKNKKVIHFKKDELGGEIMKELARLRPKMYSYIKDYDKEDKKLSF